MLLCTRNNSKYVRDWEREREREREKERDSCLLYMHCCWVMPLLLFSLLSGCCFYLLFCLFACLFVRLFGFCYQICMCVCTYCTQWAYWAHCIVDCFSVINMLVCKGFYTHTCHVLSLVAMQSLRRQTHIQTDNIICVVFIVLSSSPSIQYNAVQCNTFAIHQ